MCAVTNPLCPLSFGFEEIVGALSLVAPRISCYLVLLEASYVQTDAG